MIIRRILLSILVLFAYVSLPAQFKNPYISMDEEIYDYGTIKESDGKAVHKFYFSNTGSVPLILNDVRASCGCTTPVWTREPIIPGKKGFVEVSYDPRNRPGPFNKSITITSNAENSPVVIRIKGNVQPKEKSLEEIYRYQMGAIRLTSNHLAIGKLDYGKNDTRTLEIINPSQEEATLTFSGVPSHITIKSIPGTLKSGEKGVIQVQYNSVEKNDWGFVFDRVNVLVNGKAEPANRLTVSANIVEDFSSLSPEEMANAPVMSFSNPEFDFGTIGQDSKAEHEFEFTNTGKSDLIIRKVKASCGCTAVNPKSKIIKPGESSSIKTIFHSGKRQGKQQKTITVVSNDPKNPSTILKLTGMVQP